MRCRWSRLVWSKDKLDEIGLAYGVERRYQSYADLLKDKEIDAVHINSPIPDHGAMSIAALEAGKHVMCTVPMATSPDHCRKIVELSAKTGLKYMMAETVVYAREFLFIRQMAEKGELGRIQFVQASHQQDMDGWPNYWPGLPPMHYATHCVGPCLALERKDAEEVSCFGSGRIRDELVKHYGSPFAIESAHVKLRGSDVVARVIRSLFDTARQYRESFDVYGSKKSFEWQHPNAKQSANWSCTGILAHESAMRGGRSHETARVELFVLNRLLLAVADRVAALCLGSTSRLRKRRVVR